MCDISRHHSLARLVIVVLWSQLVSGYESAYDLTERRNHQRDDPNNRFFETSERYYNRDRYSTHNNSPSSVYSSVSPSDGDFNRRSSSFGNGYDNLGNGGIQESQFRDRRRFSEPRRFESTFRSSSRFDDPKRFDSFVTRKDDRLFDNFRDRGSLGDRTSSPANSFRDLNQDQLNIEPFRDTSLTDRSLDYRPASEPFREQYDDRRSDDLFRDGSRLDNPRILEPIRDFNRFDESRRSDRLPLPESRPFTEPRNSFSTRRNDNWDLGPKPSLQRRNDNWDTGLKPSLQRRSEHPAFYRNDYFHPNPTIKSTGFEAQNSDKTYQSNGGEKENSGLSTVGSYITSNEDQNQKKSETGFHEDKEGTKLDVENREKIGETTKFDKNGGNKSTVRKNRVHKKGSATKGFATHHHKDETGNTTTFFDENSDHGGESDYQELEDEFGSRRTSEVSNGKEDGRFFQKKGGKNGNFGTGIHKDNKKMEKDIVANDNRYNNEEKYGAGQDAVDRGFKTASEYIGGGVWQDPHHY